MDELKKYQKPLLGAGVVYLFGDTITGFLQGVLPAAISGQYSGAIVNGVAAFGSLFLVGKMDKGFAAGMAGLFIAKAVDSSFPAIKGFVAV